MPTKQIVNNNGIFYTLNPLNDTWEPLTVNEAFRDVPFRGLEGLWSGLYDFISPAYKIKKVIFNGPATIVFWQDGTKTVVKCQQGRDCFDPEKGIAMCFVKKLYNNKGRYNNVFKKWVNEYYGGE